MSLAVSIDPIFWLLCAIGFVVLEAMTWNLVSIWFAVGSAAALLSCLLVQSFRVQAAVFIAVSALCLLAFKPLAKKLRKAPTATNGDRNLGREATVLTPVTAEAAATAAVAAGDRALPWLRATLYACVYRHIGDADVAAACDADAARALAAYLAECGVRP